MRVLVVGGGLVGASSAYHLAQAGAEVVVADRRADGQATAAGAGVVLPHYEAAMDDGWRPLAAATLDHWSTAIDPLGAAAGVADTEIVFVDSPELAALLDRFRALAGVPGFGALRTSRRLEPDELAARIPVVRDGLTGHLFAGARRVDGRALTARLHAEASARGVERVDGVVTLSADGGDVRAEVDGEPVPADAVVVAAGAWSTEVCAPLGIRLPVRPVRGQILHLDTSVPGTESWPILRRLDRHYLLGFPGGRVVSGALKEPDAGFEHRRTASGVAQLLDDVLDTAPGLAPATFAEVRVGFRPGSTDGLPVLGRLARHPRVVVASGLGAQGLTFGPYAGSVAADLALGREPAVDLGAFAPDRQAR